MFESITFFNQKIAEPSKQLDIGVLVECMLFYGTTAIIANASILRQLLTYFGVDHLTELIDEGLLKIIYTDTGLGVMTKTLNGIQLHDISRYSVPRQTLDHVLEKICIDIVGKTGKGRRTARRVKKFIESTDHDQIILDGAKKSILDQEYVNDSAKSILTSLIPEKIKLTNATFYTEKTENGIIVDSNINFQEINQIYHKYVPPSHSTISPAHILSHILNTESELYFSSKHLSEIATSELSANLIANKVNYLLEKSIKSSTEILDFQQFIFSDAKSFREAVNNRKIDLDDLITILKKSSKFKKWISGVDPDQDLIKNYYDEVTKDTFADKLPGKSVRWGIFTSAGLIADAIATGGIGTAIGLGLGALDTFFIDKLISGWKPNQFIEETKKLIDKDK